MTFWALGWGEKMMAGARRQGRNDPYGYADIQGLLFSVFRNDANGFHAFHLTAYVAAGKNILYIFIFPISEPRFFSRHESQLFGMGIHGFRHGFDNIIEAFLGKGSQNVLGITAIFNEDPRFLHGTQIIIESVHSVHHFLQLPIEYIF